MDSTPLFTEQQAAHFLTVEVKTLQAWRSRGQGPLYTKLGRCVRYRVIDLQQFVSEHLQSSTSDVRRRP
jgi:hypothetical protein